MHLVFLQKLCVFSNNNVNKIKLFYNSRRCWTSFNFYTFLFLRSKKTLITNKCVQMSYIQSYYIFQIETHIGVNTDIIFILWI